MGNDFSEEEYKPKIYAGPVYMPMQMVPIPESKFPSKEQLDKHYGTQPKKEMEDIKIKACMLVAMKDSYGNIL